MNRSNSSEEPSLLNIFLYSRERIMLTPVNGEITEREPYNGYLVYQGGVPEVEEFIRRVHK